MARQTGIRYPPTLMNNSRATGKSATGHEIGVLTGSIQMETHRGPPIRFCHGCNNEVVPATSHFLWECPASGHMRRFVKVVEQQRWQRGFVKANGSDTSSGGHLKRKQTCIYNRTAWRRCGCCGTCRLTSGWCARQTAPTPCARVTLRWWWWWWIVSLSLSQLASQSVSQLVA